MTFRTLSSGFLLEEREEKKKKKKLSEHLQIEVHDATDINTYFNNSPIFAKKSTPPRIMPPRARPRTPTTTRSRSLPARAPRPLALKRPPAPHRRSVRVSTPGSSTTSLCPPTCPPLPPHQSTSTRRCPPHPASAAHKTRQTHPQPSSYTPRPGTGATTDPSARTSCASSTHSRQAGARRPSDRRGTRAPSRRRTSRARARATPCRRRGR
ncbi:hypothetical protein B0J12DRAFT_172275 [Macrophomina phaseolina]|uniref:Uncharacterized protein n=1 Tax=Macrophomina phaseolina TaxID=35725 RepID=A0ABQ8GST0_9PEZI|nr:hypothetical protein B0J12DRAFT_172275 [Macrophomina phaseolina]